MKTYLPWLDLLRLIACYLVIINHLGPPEKYIAANQLGHAGVGLFFSISGYLIGSILLSSFRKKEWLRLFYAHRFLRIYPAYLAGLTAFAIPLYLGLAHDVPKDYFFNNIVYYLTFTYPLRPAEGLGPGQAPYGIVWSLCVEEYFYLLLPLIFLLGTRLRVLAALLLVIVVNMEPRFFLLPDGEGTWFLLPNNLIGGAIMALLKPRRTGFPWIGILSGAIFLANSIGGWFEQFGPIMATVTTLIVWSFATTRLSYPPRGSILLSMGKLSYGIYLLHLPVCSLALRMNERVLGIEKNAVPDLSVPSLLLYFGVASLVALAISSVLALILNWVVEKPANSVRKYLKDNPRLITGLMICQVSLIPLGVCYHLLRVKGVLP